MNLLSNCWKGQEYFIKYMDGIYSWINSQNSEFVVSLSLHDNEQKDYSYMNTKTEQCNRQDVNVNFYSHT
jgi:hypothetical protein